MNTAWKLDRVGRQRAELENLERKLADYTHEAIGLRVPSFGDPELAWESYAAERRAAVEALAQDDAGYAAIVAEIDALKSKHEREDSLDRLVRAGVPERHAQLVVDGQLEDWHALQGARAFMANTEQTLLVLAGAPGCGKTAAAAWALAQTGGRWITASRLERVSKYDGELDKLENAPGVLVLDDLGVEHADAKGHFRSLLDGLVNERYSQRRRLVVTTNLAAEPFLSRYGTRVLDRIAEAGTFFVCRGSSRRERA